MRTHRQLITLFDTHDHSISSVSLLLYTVFTAPEHHQLILICAVLRIGRDVLPTYTCCVRTVVDRVTGSTCIPYFMHVRCLLCPHALMDPTMFTVSTCPSGCLPLRASMVYAAASNAGWRSLFLNPVAAQVFSAMIAALAGR
jgi:hypothetical protein